MIKKEFKVYSPLTHKSVKEFTTKEAGEDSERILLEGIASTTSRDLHDEIVASSAIESMAQQALALNIHGNHWYGLEDVVGAIKDSTVEDKQLKIKFLITKKYTPDIKDLLDTGVRLGLSIGGYVTNYDEKNRIINEIELHEISLTPMPANWDTFGTVTTSKGLVESNCITGACHAIVKTLNGDITMETKEETHKEEESSGLTQDDVITLFNELMAEKEETIAQEITEKVESQLESIVDAKLAEALDEEPATEEEGEEETKATEEEDEEDGVASDDETNEDEEEEDDATKSIPTIDLPGLIAESIDKALGDDFADKVASKMFDNFDKNRSTKSSKYEQFRKSLETEDNDDGDAVEEPVEKSTYSTKETAAILMQKQKAANPIMAAALKNLE